MYNTGGVTNPTSKTLIALTFVTVRELFKQKGIDPNIEYKILSNVV